MALKYKAGDQVRIKSLDWYNKNIKNNGIIICGSESFTHPMSHFCDKVVTIVTIQDDRYIILEDDGDWYWTDEMIEGLVEEETKPELKFKVGDKVITDTNMKGKIIEVVEEGWYRVEFEPHNGIPQPNGVVPEESMSLVEEEIKPKFKVGDILFYRGETSGYLKVEEIREENGEIRYYETSRNLYLIENDPDVFADKVCSIEIEKTKSEDELLDNYEELTDRAFKGGYEKCKSDIELNGFQLPEGYQFVDENGNIINTQKIILEKKPNDKLKLESTKKVREYWSEYTRIFIEIYDDDPNECILTHLFTLEGHRQKGYAKKALAEAELIARELGCHKAHLKVETNSWMYNWYLRCGYNWYKNADEGYTWLTKSI